ncbi:MAG: hypothetical protein KIS85_06295 [Anaerolineales bacterium]|nr:hypothetical protein [Anaerolineales bacterium]
MSKRTVNKFFKFVLEDVTHVLRDLPVNTIQGVALTQEWVDVSALQEAFKTWLAGRGDMPLNIGGPLDTGAAVAASGSGEEAKLSGAHTVLVPVAGLYTPLVFGAYIGMQRYWTTGDPVFGIFSAGAGDGVTVANYAVDPQAMSYSAELRLFPGTKAPVWGATAVAAHNPG